MNENRITRYLDFTTESVNHVYCILHNALRVDNNHALYYALEHAKYHNIPCSVILFQEPLFLCNQYQKVYYNKIITDLKQTLLDSPLHIAVCVTDTTSVKKIFTKNDLVIIDQCYYRETKKFITELLNLQIQSLIEIDTNLLVPVSIASMKEEYSAKTIRKKIMNNVPEYIDQCEIHCIPTQESQKAIIDFNLFLTKIEQYQFRNDPSKDVTSHMSSYLHFGIVSPLTLYNACITLEQTQEVKDYIEQLIVRRELAYNFVYYQCNYDSYIGIPQWCQRTLKEHANDPRDYVYTIQELEYAKTSDQYWNAAQQQLRTTGMMHNYMRMYWGKKIIEWTTTPQQAFIIMLELNNRYSMDGYDANSYTGIAWCFGKHDRPWTNRSIFGSIRFMNEAGIKRKFKNIENYVNTYTEDL